MASTLEDRIKKLPPKLRVEVEDFVNFLTDQNKKVSTGHLRQQWTGTLKEEGQKVVTALALQKSLTR